MITYHSIRIGKLFFKVTNGSALSAKYQLKAFDIFYHTINNINITTNINVEEKEQHNPPVLLHQGVGLEPEDEDLRQRADGSDQPGQRKHDPADEVKNYV